MRSRFLYHYSRKFELRDFFNTLGYKRRSRARAIHGSSTLSTGSRCPNVGSHEDSFGLTPDSGRGRDAALRLTVDPQQSSVDENNSPHFAHRRPGDQLAGLMSQTIAVAGSVPRLKNQFTVSLSSRMAAVVSASNAVSPLASAAIHSPLITLTRPGTFA